MNAYKRVLLKISGESLTEPGCGSINATQLKHIAGEIKSAAECGCQIAVVVGGGNIVRGGALAAEGLIHQAAADAMGMFSTVINGLAMRETLEHLGQPARLMTAHNVRTTAAEPFAREQALDHLENGRIVILTGGTGNPFCTTDTAAALRAAELDCEVILKATKVDGVYDSDPVKNHSAKLYSRLTFTEALDQRLAVMDLTAFSMCMDRDLPIVVFNYRTPGNIRSVVEGGKIGTMVRGG